MEKRIGYFSELAARQIATAFKSAFKSAIKTEKRPRSLFFALQKIKNLTEKSMNLFSVFFGGDAETAAEHFRKVCKIIEPGLYTDLADAEIGIFQHRFSLV